MNSILRRAMTRTRHCTLRVSLCVLSFSILLLPGIQVAMAAELEASAWLKKMGNALLTENYEGIYTHTYGYNYDTVKIIHQFKNGQESERRIHLNGEQRELTRVDGELVCHHAKSGRLDFNHPTTPKPFTHAFNDNLATYQYFYNISILGRDRVAGRKTIVLLISPKYSDRLGYELWLDEETGLLLESRLINQGKVQEAVQFSRIVIGEDFQDEQLLSALTGEVVKHEVSEPTLEVAQTKPVVKPEWHVAWVPNGFQSMQQAAKNRFSYSDGLATISVFVETVSNTRTGEVVARRGGTIVISRQRKGSHQLVTVVGEVPLDTARKIADSVEPVIY